MNQTLKDGAWRVFEIAFYVALGLFVLIHWKPFLVWLIKFVANFVSAYVLLLLLGAVILFIHKILPKKE